MTGVTLLFVTNLQKHARAVYACSRADRARGVRGLVAVGIIAEAIDRRVPDQLLVLIIGAVTDPRAQTP